MAERLSSHELRLKQYVVTYPKHVQRPNAPLLFSAKGGGFTAQTVVNMFKRIYALAGMRGASSHSRRRQFLTELTGKGINMRVTAQPKTLRMPAQRRRVN